MTSRQAWSVGGALLVIGALAVARVTVLRGNAPAPAGRGGSGAGGGVLSVHTAVIRTAPMTDRVSAIGTIRPNEEVQIRSEIAGKVDQVLFQEGAKVSRGDLLVKINDSELRAQLARAEARLAIATAEADRQQSLFADSLTSGRDFDNAKHEADAVRAEAEIIRAQLAKTEIRAPFDGVIGLRSVSNGSYVSPSATIASLQDHTPVKIEFSVPERYAARIRVSDKISFTVEGTQRAFVGTVYALDAAIDPVTRALRVRATSPNDDGALIPGAFANVDVVFDERETVSVPSFAVIPELKGHRVFVYRAGRAHSQSVDVGARTDEFVEIVHGLAPGDTLITSAILQLRDGAPVTIAADQ